MLRWCSSPSQDPSREFPDHCGEEGWGPRPKVEQEANNPHRRWGVPNPSDTEVEAPSEDRDDVEGLNYRPQCRKDLTKMNQISHSRSQRKRAARKLPSVSQLLRCEFLGLAFRTHEFERALSLFVGLRDFLLHLCRGLFHFWREPHVAVVLHAGAGRNEASYNDVLLEPAQVVHRSLDGGFGEHSGGLLERRRRNERVG